MREEGRTGKARRAVRLRISDLTPVEEKGREGRLGGSVLDFTEDFREFNKVLQESLSQSWPGLGILHLPGTCLP